MPFKVSSRHNELILRQWKLATWYCETTLDIAEAVFRFALFSYVTHFRNVFLHPECDRGHIIWHDKDTLLIICFFVFFFLFVFFLFCFFYISHLLTKFLYHCQCLFVFTDFGYHALARVFFVDLFVAICLTPSVPIACTSDMFPSLLPVICSHLFYQWYMWRSWMLLAAST
jgi:hypothetical protein